VIVIGISGPSASGKSFLAANLAETLSPGSTCTVIPLDRWNRDRQCPPHAKYTPTGGMMTHRLGKEMCEGPEGFPWAVIVETVNAAVQTARSTGQRYVIVEGLYPYYNAGLDALMDIRFELTPKMAVCCRMPSWATSATDEANCAPKAWDSRNGPNTGPRWPGTHSTGRSDTPPERPTSNGA
jgi:hypothetical protein